VVDSKHSRGLLGGRAFLDTSRVDREAHTEQNGLFELRDIPVGSYAVAIEAPGFAPQTKLVDMGAGSVVRLDVSLDPIDDVSNQERVDREAETC
jgi:hypothetical protein